MGVAFEPGSFDLRCFFTFGEADDGSSRGRFEALGLLLTESVGTLPNFILSLGTTLAGLVADFLGFEGDLVAFWSSEVEGLGLFLALI